MIETKEITVPATKAHTRQVKYKVCDFCGYKAQAGQTHGISTCSTCGRHACNGAAKSCIRWDPDEYGDYPDSFCPICYDLRFVKYGTELRNIETEAENKKEAILTTIKVQSLAQTPENWKKNLGNP